MSRLTIDTGTAGNPATGDSLRTAFNKVNTNFTELYAELGGDSLDAISFNNNTISTDITNANLILTGNGTGGVVIEDIEITGSTVNVLTTNNNLTLNTNGTGKVVINGLSFPITDGDAGQVLKTDGAGNLSFTSAVPGSLTIVGDDSTGTTVSIGETFKIAGTQNITTAVSGDTLTITGPNLSSYATQSYVTSQGYITNSPITVVGDDSTGVTLNSGETIKIAGTQNISTAVSGDTLTITGPNLSSYLTNSTLTVVGDDSTGVTLNSGETIRIAGAQNITTAVSGDTLTITGSKNIEVNEISSGDSTAIQVNDAINMSGAVTANSSLTANTFIQMGNGSATTLAAGRLWYDENTGALNAGMGGGNITQQIGEELFRYGKASSAINDNPLQLIYKTGTVGASGVITFAPAVAGITNDHQILGCATEPIAENGFGRITAYGVINNIATNGSYYGETWADNDDIYYNPATGGLTKTIPTSGLKLLIGTVITAGAGGAGKFIVKLGVSASIGNSSDVTIISVAANDILRYNGTAWVNTPGNITMVGDDSTGTTLNLGETIKIAGTQNITTSVSGDTLTITGPNLSSYLTNSTITVVGDDSTGTTLNSNETIKVAGTQNITTAVSGDTLTITGPNLSSYLTAVPKTIDVNEISSGDSTAIQINDAVNVSGAGTFHGSVRFNAGYTEKINALTSSSTITVNCATASIHTVTLAVSTGFVISNLPTGGTVTLIITQGGSGSYAATFGTDGSTTVKFPGGAPTLSTAVGAIDVVTIFNDGTNYLGNIAKAYAA